MIAGMMSSISLTMSTAAINTGQGTGKFHGHCAVLTFICSYIAIIYHTALCWIIHSKTKALSLTSLIIKTVLMVLLIVLGVLNSTGSDLFDI
jgi:hypothetical protein